MIFLSKTCKDLEWNQTLTQDFTSHSSEHFHGERSGIFNKQELGNDNISAALWKVQINLILSSTSSVTGAILNLTYSHGPEGTKKPELHKAVSPRSPPTPLPIVSRAPFKLWNEHLHSSCLSCVAGIPVCSPATGTDCGPPMQVVFLLDGSLRCTSFPVLVLFPVVLVWSLDLVHCLLCRVADGPCYQHLTQLAVFRSCETVLCHWALLMLGLPFAPGLPAL